jgi:trigger factor
MPPRRRLAPVAATPSAPAAPRGVTSVEESISSSSLRLTITIPADACQRAYTKLLESYRTKTKVDGYRLGKAPDSVLVSFLGGPTRFNNSVLAELLEPAMAQALEPYLGRSISESERIEQDADELVQRFQLGSDFKFSVSFDVQPELRWKTPYKELSVSVEAAGTEETDIVKAEARLLSLRKESGGKMRVAAGRGIRRGDVVIVDFSATRADTGEPLPGTQRQGMRMDTDTADEEFLPGVVDAMEGMQVGESRVAPITFPTSEDFQPASLRGVTANVTVAAKEVFEWDLPALDDAFAASVMGPGSTIAAVKERLLENARLETEEATKQRLADAFMAAVGAAVEVDIPPSMLQEVASSEYSRELNALVEKGVLSFDQVQQLASPQMVSSSLGFLLCCVVLVSFAAAAHTAV